MPSRTPTRLALLAALAALAACSSAEPQPPTLGPASGGAAAQVATFEGRFDPATGKLTISTGPTTDAVDLVGRAAMPPKQDGTAGSGPDDTFELVTEVVDPDGYPALPGPVVDGCGPGVDSFNGWVTLRSFFRAQAFSNVAIQLTEFSTDNVACDDTSDYGGMSSTLGLWDYGNIGVAGSTNPLAPDHAAVLWKFTYPASLPFTFRGRILAQAGQPLAPPNDNDPASFEWRPPMFMDPPHSFQDVATTKSHVVWNGTAFVDTKGVASFARVGGTLTSTNVGIAYPVQAYTGPWAAGGAGRYEATPTTLALDTSGDFTVCVKFKPGVNPGPLERKVLVAKGNPIGQVGGTYLAGDLGWALTQQRGPVEGGGPQYGFFYRTGNDPSATDTFGSPGSNPENSVFDYTCGGRVSTGCVITGEPFYTGPCIRVLPHGRDVRFDYKVTGTFANAESLPLVIGSAATGLWPALDEGVYEVIIDSRGATNEIMKEIVDAAEGRKTFNGAAFVGNDVDALPVLGVDGLTYGFPLGSTAPVSTDGSGLLTAGRVLRFTKVLASSAGAYCIGAEVTSPNWATAFGGILGDVDGVLRLFIPADHVATGFSGGSPAWGPDLSTAGWAANSRHVFKVCATTGSPVQLWVDGLLADSRGAASTLYDLTSAASELYVGQGRIDVFASGLVPLTGARIGRVFACPTSVATACN